MTGDSQSLRDGLVRKGRALCGVLSLIALSGCALSFTDNEGRRHVIGLFDMTSEIAADESAPSDVVRRFSFYGFWIDDAFRGTSLAFGEVELAVADLRNQWRDGRDAPTSQDDCDGGFGFHWCSLSAPSADRAGTAFDVAVSGVTIGVGERDRHFGVGYHRQVLLEVTNANALVTWPSPLELDRPGSFNLARQGQGEDGPADVGVEGLLRGSFNG